MAHKKNHLIADVPQKAIIEHNRKVLIVQDNNGKWQLPGGRLHIGEEPTDCVKREIKEELGVDVKPLRIFDCFVFTSASGTNHFAVIWICKLNGNTKDIKKDNKEVQKMKWISSIKELGKMPRGTIIWKEYKRTLGKFFGR